MIIQKLKKVFGGKIPNFKKIARQKYLAKYEKQFRKKREKLKKIIDFFTEEQRRAEEKMKDEIRKK